MQVVSPAIGERVDIGSHMSQFRVRVSDALYASATFQRIGEGYDVAFIDAEVGVGELHCTACEFKGYKLGIRVEGGIELLVNLLLHL